MQSSRRAKGKLGILGLAALGASLFLATAPPLSWGTEGAVQLVARNPVVSPPVSPGDNQRLPPALPLAILQNEEPIDIHEAPRPIPLPGAQKEGATPGATAGSPVPPPMGSLPMPAPIRNFEGIASAGSRRVYPPDTDGQVGPNHYVQIVNHYDYGAEVRVFDKTGAQLCDFGLNQLWPQGDPCHEYAYGDPVVLYDQMADRWILTQFALPDPPYYECFAVSKGATPTNNPGDWWVYSFLVHATKMNDYPKIGVWPDGYYMSVNQFTNTWAGAGAFVFDRSKMLSGSPATFQYFDLFGVDPDWGGMLPSNLMGSTLPPAGSPNYFGMVEYWKGPNQFFRFSSFTSTGPLRRIRPSRRQGVSRPCRLTGSSAPRPVCNASTNLVPRSGWMGLTIA